MGQRFRALTALTEDQGLNPRTHIGYHTCACMESQFWGILRHLCSFLTSTDTCTFTHAHIQVCMYTHRHFFLFFKKGFL